MLATATLRRTWLTLNDSEPSTRRTALGDVGRLLDGMSIRWALIGGLAANRYRSAPRYTGDVDLLLAGSGAPLPELESALTARGWSVCRADGEGSLLRANHTELGPVDLLVAGTEYQEQALQRAQVESVAGVGATPF